MASARPLGLLILSLLPAGQVLWAWGPKGHQWVAEKAILSLPQGEVPRLFLEAHRQEVIRRSMDADYRKEEDPEEFFRHFIDLERYGSFPFSQLELDYDRLVSRFGSRQVRENGVLLWAIEETYRRLVQAWREEDAPKLLLYSTDLAHYIADLHQPFHTTVNYNGQLSGQDGIHFRFENDLLNFHLDKVSFSPGPLKDYRPLLPNLFEMALESLQWVDNILVADRRIVLRREIDRQHYLRLPPRERIYPGEYYADLFKEVGSIVELRLNAAAQVLASLWQTAWQEGGGPRMSEAR